MNTNDLIKILAQAPRPHEKLHLVAFGILIVICSTVVTSLILGLRPRVMVFDFSTPLLVKLALLSMLAATAVQYLKEQSVPIAQHYAYILARITGALFAMLLINEWINVDHQKITALFYLSNFRACIFFVTCYGVLGALLLTIHMQASAPLNAKKAAAGIGFAAAATGAIGYALHCPVDSPNFIAVAYGIPVFFLTVISRIALPRFLKW